MSLTKEKIKEDLENALPDDVAFDKEIFKLITGDTPSDKATDTETDRCYAELKTFLENEDKLYKLFSELHEKQTSLEDMKTQLKESFEKLQLEKKNLNETDRET